MDHYTIKLPCNHLIHSVCALICLETTYNCPICRDNVQRSVIQKKTRIPLSYETFCALNDGIVSLNDFARTLTHNPNSFVSTLLYTMSVAKWEPSILLLNSMWNMTYNKYNAELYEQSKIKLLAADENMILHNPELLTLLLNCSFSHTFVEMDNTAVTWLLPKCISYITMCYSKSIPPTTQIYELLQHLILLDQWGEIGHEKQISDIIRAYGKDALTVTRPYIQTYMKNNEMTFLFLAMSSCRYHLTRVIYDTLGITENDMLYTFNNNTIAILGAWMGYMDIVVAALKLNHSVTYISHTNNHGFNLLYQVCNNLNTQNMSTILKAHTYNLPKPISTFRKIIERTTTLPPYSKKTFNMFHRTILFLKQHNYTTIADILQTNVDELYTITL